MFGRQTRREFLKNIGYLALGIPIISYIIPRWVKASKEQKLRPYPASYYKKLAG